MAEKQKWLLLNFTLPKNPSRSRVSVWRHLNAAGSASMGQSVWLLPDTTEQLKVFQTIKSEIDKNDGTASILRIELVASSAVSYINDMFNAARDEEYQEFLDDCADFMREISEETEKKHFAYIELEENEDTLARLEKWLAKIVARDFFGAPLMEESDNALNDCKKIFSGFREKVYKLNNK